MRFVIINLKVKGNLDSSDIEKPFGPIYTGL